MNKLCLFLVLICVAGALGAPKEKDIITKKKLLVKTRSDSDVMDIVAEAKPVEGAVVEKVEDPPVVEAVKEPEAAPTSVPKDPVVVESEKVELVDTTAETSVEKPRPSYLVRVKNLLRRVLEILGFTRQKRGSRKMHDGNFLEDEPPYTKEVRAAVGAILGREECLQKAACGAGSMLRHVRGKEVLIVLLEKFSPTSWSDSINHIRNAAVYKDPCDYKCLED